MWEGEYVQLHNNPFSTNIWCYQHSQPLQDINEQFVLLLPLQQTTEEYEIRAHMYTPVGGRRGRGIS